MTTFVVDASIAVKWVIQEEGTPEALTLRRGTKLLAPELLVAECANILWKKCVRKELSKDGAFVAARLLQSADIELVPSRSLLEPATRLAVELRHPAYDCLYLALALHCDCPFVTADDQVVRKLAQTRTRRYRNRVLSLAHAAESLNRPSPA